MRTHTAIDHRNYGWRQLEVVLLLAIPALFAFVSSIGLSYDSQYSDSGPWQLIPAPWFLSSGLWFFSEASRVLGYLGVVVAASIAAEATIRRIVSDTVSVLMASAVFTAIILLWLAPRVYQNPW